jgi:hypothetical protein
MYPITSSSSKGFVSHYLLCSLCNGLLNKFQCKRSVFFVLLSFVFLNVTCFLTSFSARDPFSSLCTGERKNETGVVTELPGYLAPPPKRSRGIQSSL